MWRPSCAVLQTQREPGKDQLAITYSHGVGAINDNRMRSKMKKGGSG